MNKIILILLSVITITYSYAEEAKPSESIVAVSEESLNGIGLAIGLQGFTLFYDRILSDTIGVRVGYSFLKFKKTFSLKVAKNYNDFFTIPPSSLSVSPSLTGISIPLLFDFYVGSHTGFRFTTGMYLQLNPVVTLKLKAQVTDKDDITSIKKITVTIGDSDKVLPYLGFGYSTHESNLEGFKFIFDVGVLLSDTTHKVRCVGCTQTELNDLKGNKFKKTFGAITRLKYAPQIAFGVKYQF